MVKGVYCTVTVYGRVKSNQLTFQHLGSHDGLLDPALDLCMCKLLIGINYDLMRLNHKTSNFELGF